MYNDDFYDYGQECEDRFPEQSEPMDMSFVNRKSVVFDSVYEDANNEENKDNKAIQTV